MQTYLQNSHKIAPKNRQMSTLMTLWADTPILHCKIWYAFFALQKTRIISTSWGDVAMMFPVCYKPMALPWRFTWHCGHANVPWGVYHGGHSPQPNWRFAMNIVILGAKTAMPTHKPEVYWQLRPRAHQKDTPGCENDQSATPACNLAASKKCVSYFAQQKLRTNFCDVDVTFMHSYSNITTSCKILILHYILLFCKTSLVFGDVGLVSHLCVIFVVQNLLKICGDT